MSTRARFSVAVASLLGAAVTPCVAGAEGGAGSYTSTGTTFEFRLSNTGGPAWQYFDLVGPSGSSFVGGATVGESTAHCVVGGSGGLPNEIVCGPLSATGLAPGATLLFVAAMSSDVACGQSFELAASASGSVPYPVVAEVASAGPCAVAAAAAATATSPSPPVCVTEERMVALATGVVARLDRRFERIRAVWGAGSAEAARGVRLLSLAQAGRPTSARLRRAIELAIADTALERTQLDRLVRRRPSLGAKLPLDEASLQSVVRLLTAAVGNLSVVETAPGVVPGQLFAVLGRLRKALASIETTEAGYAALVAASAPALQELARAREAAAGCPKP